MFGRRRKKQMQQHAPDTGVRTHESGYIMRTGEHMVLGQEAASPEGNGWLLATNRAFFFIHHRRGIYLYLDQYMITSLTNDQGRITVKWLEKGRQFKFQMRPKEGFHTPDEIVSMLNMQFQYAGSAFEHVKLTEEETEDARKKRVRSHENEVAHAQDMVKRIEKGEFGEARKGKLGVHRKLVADERKNLEYVKDMPFVRSAKVPSHIPLYLVWNDCYYDGARNVFVTFRKFRNGLGPKTLANQKEINPGGEGLAFSWGDLTFKYGYPAIVERGTDGHFRASLLCTLTEEMITDDLIIALHAIQRDLDRDDLVEMGTVYYETEAPRWIGGKFFKMTDRERRIGLRYLPWLAFTNNPDIPWIKPYKIIPFGREQAARP